jgi:hypothetical protein
MSKQLGIPIVDKLESGTFIVLGIHREAKYFLERQIRDPSIKYIIFQTEQLSSKWFNEDKPFLALLKRNPVYCWSPTVGREMVTRHKIDYQGIFNWSFIDRRAHRKTPRIDLFFCGTNHFYRHIIQLKIEKMGFRSYFNYNMTPTDIIEHMLESNWVLNIRQMESSALETHRINAALACGCRVISTRSKCPDLDKKYAEQVHFIDDWGELLTLIEPIQPREAWTQPIPNLQEDITDDPQVFEEVMKRLRADLRGVTSPHD